MATWQMYRSALRRTVIVRGRGTVSSYCLRVAPGPPRYRPRRTFLSLVSPARPSSSWGGCFRGAPSAPRVTPPFPSPSRSTLRSSSLDAPCSRLPRCLGAYRPAWAGASPRFFMSPTTPLYPGYGREHTDLPGALRDVGAHFLGRGACLA